MARRFDLGANVRVGVSVEGSAPFRPDKGKVGANTGVEGVRYGPYDLIREEPLVLYGSSGEGCI